MRWTATRPSSWLPAMNKFLVTLVDGSQVLCYTTEQLLTNDAVVRCAVLTKLDEPLRRHKRADLLLWAMGVASVGPDLLPRQWDGVMHLPRCYLNTPAGQDRLALLALTAKAAKTL